MQTTTPTGRRARPTDPVLRRPRSLVGLLAVLAVALGALATAGTRAEADPAALVEDLVADDDGVVTGVVDAGLGLLDVVARDGDAVVLAPRAGEDRTEAKAGASGSNERTVHDGYATFGDPDLLDAYTIRLTASPGIEQVRPYAERAAGGIRDAGQQVAVAPGTVDRHSPNQGQIDIVVSESSPCSGSWLACGGPTMVEGTVHSGRIWVNPRLLSRSDHDIANTIAHELGHTMGLAHYDDVHRGEVQVMHSSRFDHASYRSGDRDGIADNAGVAAPAPAPAEPRVEVRDLRYAAGRIGVRGVASGVPAGGRLRLEVGGAVSQHPAGTPFDLVVAAPGGRLEACVTLLDGGGGALDRDCGVLDAPTDPFGEVDVVQAGAFTVRILGWAVDPQTSAPVDVVISVDGRTSTTEADLARDDVARSHPAYGPDHGFDVRRVIAPGVHEVCAVALDVAEGRDAVLACVDVAVGGPVTALRGIAAI